MIKAIIFDFDGVIVESVDIKTDAFKKLYKKYGTDVLNKVVNHHLNNGGMSRQKKIKVYHKEYLNINISEQEISSLSNEFSSYVKRKVVGASYVAGAERFIIENSNKFLLFISTGTPIDEINYILDKRGINLYFKKVFGSPTSKIDHINQIMYEYKLKSNEIIFVGDATTDLNAAKEKDIPFILRVHNNNYNQFESYVGSKISDLNELYAFTKTKAN